MNKAIKSETYGSENFQKPTLFLVWDEEESSL